jgi:hypothetical protein
MKDETANFDGHLEDYEKILTASSYHIYQCIKPMCDVEFAVSQQFSEQDIVKCPVCTTEDALITIGQGMMIEK